MSNRYIITALPLTAGTALIAIAILVTSEGAFVIEWMGSFLAFYGLSQLIGTRTSITLSMVILVAGSLGDIILLGGLTPLNWTIVNYMVFIHSAAGTLTNHIITHN